MTTDSLTPSRPRALSRGHFRQIACTGFGDGRNSYSWSCAWFNEQLYIGTNRNTLVVVKKRIPLPFPTIVHPVPVPPEDDFEMRAQIWRFNPRTDTWQRVYQAPLVPGLQGRTVSLGVGFRNMGVFQGKSDCQPAIYAIPGCGSYGIGPVLLRSEDGEHFEIASKPGLGLGDMNVINYRGLVPFKGRLFIAPAGARGGHGNTSYNMTVLCSDDPVSGRWEVSNPDRFNDPTNHGIFEMGVVGDYLYLGTINPRFGFQIWKTNGEGPPPHRWSLVLDRGADRGPHNEGVACFAGFQGALFAGTGIQGGGMDRFNNVGPAAAELLRIYPDDSWDLVMGVPRMTRQGLKVPSSGYGPGFNNETGCYLWRLRAHDGALYATTYDMFSLAPFTDPQTWPIGIRRIVDKGMLENYLRMRVGGQLWRTTNGDQWTPVTLNGFGNPYNWGFCCLVSSPRGLFVGTANPFGPQVAVEGPAGWRYEPNPRGGTEIWLGAWDHAGLDSSDESYGDRAGLDCWLGQEEGFPGSLSNSLSDLGENAVPELENSVAERRELLRALAGFPCSDETLERHALFAIREVEAEQEERGQLDPVRRTAAVPKDLAGLAERVTDEVKAYFAGGPRNVGYWRDERVHPRQACEQLLAELLAFLPSDKDRADPEKFVSISTEGTAQAKALRELRPGSVVEAVASDAVHRTAAASFDTAVWVEGPSVADRRAAVREVWKLLKPGGQFLAAEALGFAPEKAEDAVINVADLISSYQEELSQAGYANVRVVDVTRETWGRFFRHSREFFATKLLLQQLDRERLAEILAALPGGQLIVTAYVLISARKPTGSARPQESSNV